MRARFHPAFQSRLSASCRPARLCATWVAALVIAGHICTAKAAGPYDPDVDYFTLTTPHYLVMYPKGYEHIALRTARIAEDTWPYLAKRYDWEPAGRISIIINDQTDFANGSATVFPSKIVTIFVTAPTRISGLEDYDDWLTTVVQHELAHIFHLDMAYGLPAYGRWLFGKYVSMNVYNPGWVTEGLAVFEETVASGAGRGRSYYVDMVVRAAALADRFPPIDQGYRGYPNWPFSNVAYFFGGRFQLWLAEKYGEKTLLDYHRAYASNPIPFFTYLPAKLKFDTSLESLWITFEQEMIAESKRQLEVMKRSPLGLTKPERLTFHGGESVGPRITPDGRFVIFSTGSPVDGPRVRRLDLSTKKDEPLVNDTLSQAITFSKDGGAFYYQQTEINQRFYAHNSIFRYEIKSGRLSRIQLAPGTAKAFKAPSGSLRIRDPDISKDGKRIVMVQTPYAANRLLIAWLESDGISIHPKVLVDAEPDVQLSTPRFSPNGDLIAVSRFARGRRDIVIYNLEGELVREVTRDRAQDTDPTWSPDGRWLVFASDQSGAYNLYAYDMQTNTQRQLSNLVTGAFQPSIAPNGKFLVYRGYSADGFDVYRLPFEPEKGLEIDRPLEPQIRIDRLERNWPPRHPESPDIPAPAPPKDTPLPKEMPKTWAIKDYSPFDTILPFNDNWNLFPAVLANEREFFASLTHFGADARQTHSYSLNLTYGTFTKFVGGSAAYSYDGLEPTFSVFGQARAVTFPRRFFVDTGAEQLSECGLGGELFRVDNGGQVTERPLCYGRSDGAYNERRLSGTAAISLPLLQRHNLSVAYTWEDRRALGDLPDGTVNQLLPRQGRYNRLSLGYSYANVRRFPYSISLERGPSFAIALSAFSKGLGSDFEQFLLTTEGRYYLDIPWPWAWAKNHVIAARLGLGVGAGPDTVETFRLGGVAGVSGLTTTTENFYALRGLATSALSGTGVISSSVEYRAPIYRIDRGIGTFPITFRVLHFAAFADVGRTFDKVNASVFRNGFFDEFAVGVGAEVRADIILSYNFPLTLRLGYAYPVVFPGSLDRGSFADGVYFQLGSLY